MTEPTTAAAANGASRPSLHELAETCCARIRVQRETRVNEPKLKPLEQFICDTCGELIEEPRRGRVEWLSDPPEWKAREFRIVHCLRYGPRKRRRSCSRHINAPGFHHLPLAAFTGAGGQALLISFLDRAGMSGPPNAYTPANLPAFGRFMRRLTLPHFEEAQCDWAQATADGFFKDERHSDRYAPATLRELIRMYGR